MFPTKLLIPVILAAGIGLTGCQKTAEDKQADVVRDTTEQRADTIEQRADVVENAGEQAGGVTEQNAETNADSMRANADSVREQGEINADAIEDKK